MPLARARRLTRRPHRTSTDRTPRRLVLAAHSNTRISAKHTTAHQQSRYAPTPAPPVKYTPPHIAHGSDGSVKHTAPCWTRLPQHAPTLTALPSMTWLPGEPVKIEEFLFRSAKTVLGGSRGKSQILPWGGSPPGPLQKLTLISSRGQVGF